MYDNYAILKFKKFLESISIDIWLVLFDEEFKEEYYTMEYLPSKEYSTIIDDNGITECEPYTVPGDQIWAFGFNGIPIKGFFEKYSSLEKDLIEEMSLNSKIIKDFDEFDSLYEGLSNWLLDKVNGIKYEPDIDLFECNYSNYCSRFDKITFKSKYDKDIQTFLKELKNRLMLSYSKIIEKIPSPIYKPNLKWEGHDTDLIELITALLENKSIKVKVSKDGKTHRNEVIRQFEQIFEIKLKDSESKLSRATERADNSVFLSTLQKAYKIYANNKLEKNK